MLRRLAILLTASALALPAADPVGIIFDTDMGNDIDDALALAILHNLSSRGECKLLAVTVTKDNPWAPRFVTAINRFYGRDKIPVGMVTRGVTPQDGNFNRQTLEGGRHHWREPDDDALTVLRKTLSEQADQSVVIVQVGFSTNLARLLDSPADRKLIVKKVKRLSVMGGWFPDGKPEYNIKEDVASARKLVAAWPTKIIFSGFEVGKAIKYPASSIEKDFKPGNPVAEAYRHYMKMPYDRETWDLTSALYAVRPNAAYFDLSEPGTVVVSDNGETRLQPDSKGKHRYLKASPEQQKRVLDEFLRLAPQ